MMLKKWPKLLALFDVNGTFIKSAVKLPQIVFSIISENTDFNWLISSWTQQQSLLPNVSFKSGSGKQTFFDNNIIMFALL